MASVAGSFQPFEFDTTLKVLSDASNLKDVPSKFNFTNEPTAFTSDSLPIFDFSQLVSGDQDERSRAIQDLASACRDWGFFILVNHGIPETSMNATFTATKEFFSLPESEKKQYHAKSASDPIKCGNFNVANASNQSFTLWRDYLKLYVHPEFHCPHQPQLLREAVLDYTQRTRKLAVDLVQAVCDAFELDRKYADQVLELDSSFQMFAANYYPPCPQPDQAIGIPPHTDPGLFTFLIHNGVAGLQIEHDGKWFNADSPLLKLRLKMELRLQIRRNVIFTNGRCKSVKHRAVVNEERERISIVVANGPSGAVVVGPAAPLVEKDGRAKYYSMMYEEYVESQLTKSRVNFSLLEQQMVQDN